MEPPVSVPTAKGTTSAATATADPLLEPVKLPDTEQKFDKLARDITDMVPV